MSAQFGRWNFAGASLPARDLEKIFGFIAPYGPDGGNTYRSPGVNIIYRAFHTTNESVHEVQPLITEGNSVICWDGRLDNRKELLIELNAGFESDCPDVLIVATGYDRWKTECFRKFIGDWALSIWNPATRSLILARDVIGVRQLYYECDQKQVTWSTILDPFVLLSKRSFALSGEYIAGWYSSFPAGHLTPYVGIHAVPPACFVQLQNGERWIKKYWDFDPDLRIRYGTDAEYEEHFRHVFATAVKRRLRSQSPILAELSGGLDSSSIVCMADEINRTHGDRATRVDTISYFDDSEPNWDERSFFTKVEEKRGRTGCHIDVRPRNGLEFFTEGSQFWIVPGSAHRSGTSRQQFKDCLFSNGNRIVLSGIGGDEVTGGVPTPAPELEDLLARGRFGQLIRRLKIWAVHKRVPWSQLLVDSAGVFLPEPFGGIAARRPSPPWMNRRFARRYRAALGGYDSRLKLFGPLPSFQENISTLSGLRRQIGCRSMTAEPLFEKRYPYLDRDLLAFLFSIPREQHVRPNERRSLMRRSLKQIVPEELLNRKRKAFVARAPIIAISNDWPKLILALQTMTSGSLGIVNAKEFSDTLDRVRKGHQTASVVLFRALAIETWLKQLQFHGILAGID